MEVQLPAITHSHVNVWLGCPPTLTLMNSIIPNLHRLPLEHRDPPSWFVNFSSQRLNNFVVGNSAISSISRQLMELIQNCKWLIWEVYHDRYVQTIIELKCVFCAGRFCLESTTECCYFLLEGQKLNLIVLMKTNCLHASCILCNFQG